MLLFSLPVVQFSTEPACLVSEYENANGEFCKREKSGEGFNDSFFNGWKDLFSTKRIENILNSAIDCLLPFSKGQMDTTLTVYCFSVLPLFGEMFY